MAPRAARRGQGCEPLGAISLNGYADELAIALQIRPVTGLPIASPRPALKIMSNGSPEHGGFPPILIHIECIADLLLDAAPPCTCLIEINVKPVVCTGAVGTSELARSRTPGGSRLEAVSRCTNSLSSTRSPRPAGAVKCEERALAEAQPVLWDIRGDPRAG